MSKTAFILGYTGESGKELVKALCSCEAFTKLVLIGRRQADLEEKSEKIVSDIKSISLKNPFPIFYCLFLRYLGSRSCRFRGLGKAQECF